MFHRAVVWLASLLLHLHILLRSSGARFIGPTAQKAAAAASRDEVLSLSYQIGRYGRIEFSAMLLMVALMVAMHAGY